MNNIIWQIEAHEYSPSVEEVAPSDGDQEHHSFTTTKSDAPI
jgi:hypothetical protein